MIPENLGGKFRANPSPTHSPPPPMASGIPNCVTPFSNYILKTVQEPFCLPLGIPRCHPGYGYLTTIHRSGGEYPTLATDTEVNSCFSIYENSEIIYTKKIDLDDFFTCHGCKPGRHFFSSCSELNSTGYSEFNEPISARLQHYPLF